MQKNLFVVSSAIDTPLSIYSKAVRFAQTLQTMQSIQKYAPNSDIVILDAGQIALENSDKDYLLEQGCTMLIDYTQEPFVQNTQATQPYDVIKNLIELNIFHNYYQQLHASGKSYERIFKLSGRYVLNEHFDLAQHLDAHGQVVVKGPLKTQFRAEITNNAQWQYMSRLVSFDRQMLGLMVEVYAQMCHKMSEMINSGHYLDIEHLLFQYLPPDKVRTVSEFEHIGVSGRLGGQGLWVHD